MAVTLTTDQKVGLTLVGKSAAGAVVPFTPDAPDTFVTGDASVVAVTSVDVLSASVVSVGPGVAVVTATVSIKGQVFVETITIEVASPDVATVEIVAGTPEPK